MRDFLKICVYAKNNRKKIRGCLRKFLLNCLKSFIRRGSTLSRQSTNESNDSDTTTPTQSFIQSSSTIGSTSGDKQPIKKSPREFIIPISVEGGGIVRIFL